MAQALDTTGAEFRRPPQLATPRAFILHYIRAWPWHFAALSTMVVLAATSAVGIQYEMKLLVDAMARVPQQVNSAWIALAVFIALVAFESIMWRLSGWLACRTTIGVGVQIRLDLFDYLSHQSMRYFADNLAGSLGHRITGTAGNFGALTNTMIWRIGPPVVDFLGALVIFWLVDWRMAVIMGAYVVVVTSGLIVLGERGRPLHSTYAAKSNVVGGEIIDVISNMWAVKAFSAREREWRRLREHFEAEAGAQRTSWMYTEKVRVLYDVVLWFMAAGMLAWALYQWTRRTITPGDVVVVSALTFRILHGSRDAALALVDLVQQFGYIDDTLHVIGKVPTVVDSNEAHDMERRRGSIEFRNVSFHYDRRGQTLRDFSLYVPPGQKLGVAGPSGAGKSTLISLMQRLYDVQDGAVLIDGEPVERIKQDSLRASLSVVPQEISLFHRTVMENIRFGRPEATDQEVFEAASAACCDEFARRLPDGYDTIVGERGVKLSGGQRQRIGIARAFLKNAPILIMDEATSALDTESEMRIQRNLIEKLQGRTVIAVAHRLSTLVGFDRIIVIVDGAIVEEGTAAELRARNGVFEKLWRLQTEGLAITGSSQRRRA
ncbi:ABC transporter ATP-binding protein [Steroidobacter gossypii]|uniref:ABC transporter ATP-binding protein n=1 Tax=Steroidobacter gossypii TaxID=2805490 RepID=UPI003899A641